MLLLCCEIHQSEEKMDLFSNLSTDLARLYRRPTAAHTAGPLLDSADVVQGKGQSPPNKTSVS